MILKVFILYLLTQYGQYYLRKIINVIEIEIDIDIFLTTMLFHINKSEREDVNWRKKKDILSKTNKVQQAPIEVGSSSD